jgi:hypothetical protein
VIGSAVVAAAGLVAIVIMSATPADAAKQTEKSLPGQKRMSFHFPTSLA